ncbi:MAG TPA: hypothetical protein VIR54_12855 [Vicinamibacterales bacterium]
MRNDARQNAVGVPAITPGGNIKPDAARRKLQFRVNPSGGSNGRTRRSEGCFTFNSSRERIACRVE